MEVTVTCTPTPNHDERSLKLDCTGCHSTIVKGKLGSTCGKIFSMFYRFSNVCSCVSYCQLTWHDLTSGSAAVSPPTDNYDAVLEHDSCMVQPLLAEKGNHLRGKMVGIVRWGCLTSLGWTHGMICFTSLCGSLSSPLDHGAKRCKKWQSMANIRHKPPVDFRGRWQRGSGQVSLGRRMDERMISMRSSLRGGEVTLRKRRDGALGECFNAFVSSCSSGDDQSCNNGKAVCNTNNTGRFSLNQNMMAMAKILIRLLTWSALVASDAASRRHFTIRLTTKEETRVEKWAEWVALLEDQGSARSGRCYIMTTKIDMNIIVRKGFVL